MFDFEGKPDWFEVQHVCVQCGQLFIADYRYNLNTCSNCRCPKKKEEEEIVIG
jgi:predicted  nucleic acid-binding Zn-ribbon protein